jgi:hypothetical protein
VIADLQRLIIQTQQILEEYTASESSVKTLLSLRRSTNTANNRSALGRANPAKVINPEAPVCFKGE